MANNLRKFNTYSDYEAAELVKPAVSLIAATDEVIFDQKDAPVPPTPTFSGLTAHYNINAVGEYALFNGGGSGSGSGSGSGGALPSAMIVDGTAVEVSATYVFDTIGEHIVNYSFADNQIPEHFMDSGFGNFDSLVEIEIGDAITSIGDNAFVSCTGLTSCTIGSGVTSIGYEVFTRCISLTSIDIPDSVTSIGNSAFDSCSGLTSCTIGSGVTSIGDGAFYGCSGLTSCTIGSGVTSIGENTFNSCTSLTSCTIGSGVTSIGSNAFYTCSGLTSVDIPSGVTYIGESAFRDCRSLTSVTIEATTPPTLGNYALSSNDCPIYVPAASVSAYINASSWDAYTHRIEAIQ